MMVVVEAMMMMMMTVRINDASSRSAFVFVPCGCVAVVPIGRLRGLLGEGRINDWRVKFIVGFTVPADAEEEK